ERDDPPRTREFARRQEGRRRADGHQPTGAVLLPCEIPPRLSGSTSVGGASPVYAARKCLRPAGGPGGPPSDLPPEWPDGRRPRLWLFAPGYFSREQTDAPFRRTGCDPRARRLYVGL